MALIDGVEVGSSRGERRMGHFELTPRSGGPMIEERRLRCSLVNAFVALVASVGRQFWRDQGRIAHMEVDDRGRLWWHTEYGHRIYLHRKLHDHQLGGGTLRDLTAALKQFVMSGAQLHPLALGPWPDWVCGDGDRWGYGSNAMAQVRSMARALGVLGVMPETLDSD